MDTTPDAPNSARLRLWQAFLGGRVLVAGVLLALLLLQAWSLPGTAQVSQACLRCPAH